MIIFYHTDMALDFGDLLGEGPYKKQEGWQVKTEQDLREKLEGKAAWPYQTFRLVLIYLGLTGGHVPATATPNEIDLGPIDQTMGKMVAATNTDGNERIVDYYAGLTTGKLFESTVKTGGKDYAYTSQPNHHQDAKQRRVFSGHSHPSDIPGTFAQCLGDADIAAFLKDESLCAGVAFGKHMLMAVKTTALPDNLTPGKIDQRVTSINQDVAAVPADTYKYRVTYAANLSKWLALEFGLSLYFGKIGQPLKKVDLSRVVDL